MHEKRRKEEATHTHTPTHAHTHTRTRTHTHAHTHTHTHTHMIQTDALYISGNCLKTPIRMQRDTYTPHLSKKIYIHEKRRVFEAYVDCWEYIYIYIYVYITPRPHSIIIRTPNMSKETCTYKKRRTIETD